MIIATLRADGGIRRSGISGNRDPRATGIQRRGEMATAIEQIAAGRPGLPLRILRAKDAAGKIGVSRAKFYELRKRGDFPRQVRSEATGVAGYWEHELDAWLWENYG